jgi:hypothetical protein
MGAGDPSTEEALLRCDTCGRLSVTVSRVVVDAGYDRSNARPLYNCPDCYERKLAARVGAGERGTPMPLDTREESAQLR